jgi:endonuclease/exonuclease/phosphatase (EEP) superfamily protein YafD
MSRKLIFVLTGLLTLANAQADADSLADRYYKVVPLSLAHTSSGVPKEKMFKSDSIKVLVWNIKKAEMVPWKDEFTQYGKDRDLFLIQEAYQNELFTTTLATFKEVRWDMGISFLYRIYNDTATGSMIGSNAEPSYVKVLHTQDLEPVTETPKATTFAKYAIDGSDKEVLVISVHGINITSFDTFKRHMLLAKAEIDNHDGPVLFAGDFNTRTSARTEYLEDFVKELNFKTITFENGECRMKFKFTPYYLDHGFVRGLDVKNAKVDCDSQGSDHKPLMLELALSK